MLVFFCHFWYCFLVFASFVVFIMAFTATCDLVSKAVFPDLLLVYFALIHAFHVYFNFRKFSFLYGNNSMAIHNIVDGVCVHAFVTLELFTLTTINVCLRIRVFPEAWCTYICLRPSTLSSFLTSPESLNTSLSAMLSSKQNWLNK